MKKYRTHQYLNNDNQLENHVFVRLTEQEIQGILHNDGTIERILVVSGAPFSDLPKITINRKTKTAMVVFPAPKEV